MQEGNRLKKYKLNYNVKLYNCIKVVYCFGHKKCLR